MQATLSESIETVAKKTCVPTYFLLLNEAGLGLVLKDPKRDVPKKEQSQHHGINQPILSIKLSQPSWNFSLAPAYLSSIFLRCLAILIIFLRSALGSFAPRLCYTMQSPATKSGLTARPWSSHLRLTDAHLLFEPLRNYHLNASDNSASLDWVSASTPEDIQIMMIERTSSI